MAQADSFGLLLLSEAPAWLQLRSDGMQGELPHIVAALWPRGLRCKRGWLWLDHLQDGLRHRNGSCGHSPSGWQFRHHLSWRESGQASGSQEVHTVDLSLRGEG